MPSTRNPKTKAKAKAARKAAKKAAKPTKAKPARPTTPKPEAVSDEADVRTPPTEIAVKPLSGLDAAAQVLREAGEPLNAQDLVARILERGLWSTAGKTPTATISSAMIREIKAKGSGSRFQKVDRGRFTAAG